MDVVNVSMAEFAQALLAQERQTFYSMVSATDPDMIATGNPYRIGKGRNAVTTIHKINKVHGSVGADFAQVIVNRAKADVIRERAAAGEAPLSPEALETEAQSRYERGESWHVPLRDANGKPTCLSVHRDDEGNEGARMYLRFIFKAKGVPEWVRKDDGGVVAFDDVRAWIRPNRAPTNQDIEKPVLIATYALSSIVEASFGGVRYRVADTLASLSEGARATVLGISEDYSAQVRRMAVV